MQKVIFLTVITCLLSASALAQQKPASADPIREADRLFSHGEDAARDRQALALIERALPIFLELFARSLQGRPEYAAAAGRIFGRATAELGQLLSGPGSPRDRGGKVVGLALSTIFARSVATHDVPVPRPGGLRPASSRLSL